MGGGGYVLRDPKGALVTGGGFYYGAEAKTNNVAEARAMRDAVQSVLGGEHLRG